MEASALIPYAEALPAPWGLLNFLLILTFIVHIILANCIVGTGVILFFNHLRPKSPLNQSPLTKDIAHKIPMGTALTVNLGVAPLLFLQVMYGQFIYVSSVLMAVFWVSIFVLVIAAYYLAYVYDYKHHVLAGWKPWVIGLSMLLFLVVSYFFTRSLLLMLNPESWSQYFTRPSGTLLNAEDISMLPRYLHFVLSSLAIGGLVIALLGERYKKKGDIKVWEAARQGYLWYGTATLINFIMGCIYLITLPGPVLAQVIDGGSLATLYLLIGVVAGLASIPAAFSRQGALTAYTCLLSVLTMILFRYEVRAAYMAEHLDPAKMPLVPQYGPLLVFVITLILGLALIAYMIKLVLRDRKEA